MLGPMLEKVNFLLEQFAKENNLSKIDKLSQLNPQQKKKLIEAYGYNSSSKTFKKGSYMYRAFNGLKNPNTVGAKEFEDFFNLFGETVAAETNKGYFPTLTIGEGQVLKSFEFNFDLDDLGSVTSESNLYQYKKSYIDTDENGELLTNPILINFHFGDTESGNNYEYSYSPKENEKILNSTLDNKLKIVSSGEFGDFYKFNFENIYFQNSLIGKLYEKFDLKNIDKNSDSYKIEAAVKVYDYMFYVNNSTLTDGIKQTIVNKFLEIYKTTQDKEEIETQINNYINYSSAKKVDLTEEEIIKNGFNGQIGNIIKENGVEKYFFTLEDNLKTKGKSFDKDKTL
ncbi:hypothetical protein FQR65_LT18422 [Abscondita terminalis]|nr:hypothetical protein FQR65_LT18422 [Abscondita terminalis]